METLLSIGECTEPAELEERLKKSIETGKPLIAYNGFEPSGIMTFAQCMTAIINVNKLIANNCEFIFYVADTFAELNNKFGRDKRKIHKAGELAIEIWHAAGMNKDKVKFVWASEMVASDPTKYWSFVTDVASKFSLTRMKKGTPALGREESDELPLSTMFYVAMQIADIFFLNVDIAQMGRDQDKINMLAREYAEKAGNDNPTGKRLKKPIILSHKILGGLDGTDKMSKSNPLTAIFMTDSESEINRKVKQAFCAEGVPQGPLFDICEAILLQLGPLPVKHQNNESTVYNTFAQLCEDFTSKRLHPGDLKPAVAARINEILEPVRRHFTENKEAAALLRTVSSYKVTK